MAPIRTSILLFVILMLTASAGAVASNITISVSPSNSPLLTAIGAEQSWTITVNQTANITVYINSSHKRTDIGVTTMIYTNYSPRPKKESYNVTFSATNANGTNSTSINWTVADAPIISAVSPAAGSTTSTRNAIYAQTFNTTLDQIGNVTWTLDGVGVQINASVTVANYTNSNITPAFLGTHTITATTNNTNGTGNTLTWYWNVPAATMTNLSVSTNLSTAGRVRRLTNSSLNFTWNSTGNITRANFTFPAGFNFSYLIAVNVSTNLGTPTITLDLVGGVVSVYNATGLNNSVFYVYFPVNVTSPETAGNYNVTLKTNKNAAGTNFTIYSRNVSRPYLSVANNSNFTVGTETYGEFTTTIPLGGSGHTNLTLYGPNITGQTNITAGYSATNASKLRVVYTGGASGDPKGNYTIYIETDSSVVDPVIVLSAANEMKYSNLPSAIVTGAGVVTITGLTVLYIFRRRRN